MHLYVTGQQRVIYRSFIKRGREFYNVKSRADIIFFLSCGYLTTRMTCSQWQSCWSCCSVLLRRTRAVERFGGDSEIEVRCHLVSPLRAGGDHQANVKSPVRSSTTDKSQRSNAQLTPWPVTRTSLDTADVWSSRTRIVAARWHARRTRRDVPIRYQRSFFRWVNRAKVKFHTIYTSRFLSVIDLALRHGVSFRQNVRYLCAVMLMRFAIRWATTATVSQGHPLAGQFSIRVSNGTRVPTSVCLLCRIDANRRCSHVFKERHRMDVLRRKSVAHRKRIRGVRGFVLPSRDRREGTSDAERGGFEI